MDYETEEQQIEALRRWWTENGKSVILGVFLGAAVIGGWQFFRYHQKNQALAASDEFGKVMNGLDSGEIPAEALASLEKDHGKSLYGVMARLAAARDAVQQGDLASAEAQLRAAADNSEITEIGQIASIRLARVLGAAGKFDEGLSALPAGGPEQFAAMIEEVRGDLYLGKGDAASARAAYQKALDSTQQVADRNGLSMKLDDLAEVSSGGSESN